MIKDVFMIEKDILRTNGVIKANLAITFKCNYKCLHCNIWKIYQKTPHLVQKEISVEDFLKVLNNTKTLRWVSITGGEPFLKDNIKLLLVKLPAHVRILSINTNGSLPTKAYSIIKDAIQENPNVYFHVAISLDGPREIHNKIRGNNKAFERAISLFSKLRDIANIYRNLKVNFEYTINPWNLGQFDKMISELNSQGILIYPSELLVTIYSISNYYNISQQEHNTFFYNNWTDKIMNEIENIIKSFYKFTFEYRNIFNRAFLSLSKDFLSHKLRHNCFAGEKSVLVDPYGNVKPCIFREYILGNIKENYDLNMILLSQRAMKFRKEFRPKCNGCWTPCEVYTTFTLRPFLLLRGMIK